jgi:hypothetical protein
LGHRGRVGGADRVRRVAVPERRTVVAGRPALLRVRWR